MQELTARASAYSDDRSAREELGDLYRTLAGPLRQIVRFSVRAPDALLDDACQIAWSRLLRCWGSIRADAALPWLVTTANREALGLLRHSRRELPLDELRAQDLAPASPVCLPAAPEEIAELRAKLDELRALPPRQQRLLWLQGLGLSYAEMARYTGATARTVERQLMRAKRALRAAPG